MVRTCLFSTVEHDVKKMLRGGATDDEIKAWLGEVGSHQDAGTPHRTGRVHPARAHDEFHRRLDLSSTARYSVTLMDKSDASVARAQASLKSLNAKPQKETRSAVD